MAKKLSLGTKIVIGISAVAVVGAVAVFGVMMANGAFNKEQPSPTQEATTAPAPASDPETPVPPIESSGQEPTSAPTPAPVPIEGNVACNWELTIKDSQEYMYTEDNETLKKFTTVDISATKKGGTNYFGEYIGTGTVTVFNALSPEDDALPVYFGGQYAVTRKFDVRFTIEKTGDFEQPEGFSEFVERDYDGKSELKYALKLDKIVGIFADALELEGIAAHLGIEFSFPDPEQSKAVMYVDGGYVFLSFENGWQVSDPFVGYIVGVNAGSSTPRRTSTPNTSAPNPTPTPTTPGRSAEPAPTPTTPGRSAEPAPTPTPSQSQRPIPSVTAIAPSHLPIPLPTPTPVVIR